MLGVLLLCLVALSQAYEATIDNFQLWSADHGKTYATESERILRSMIWLDNAQFVKAKNAENTGVTYKLNQFGDLTHSEYEQILSPVYQADIEKVKETQEQLEFPEWLSTNIPDTVDWRTENVVTAIKNQGMCGSCYAFSTTGALEGACAIKNKKLVSLSEQQIMDCSWSYGNNGCNGGMFDRAFYYIQQNGGLDTEKSYPYEEKESYQCKFNKKTVGGTVSDFYYVKQWDENALAVVLAVKGPVAIAINAGMRDFQFYHSGVYDNPNCKAQLNHGVLAVGYGTEKASGKDYFLVKNSWGTQWGDAGYIKMRRNSNNQCGISTYASLPEC